jgi:hypothetical protein
MMRFLITVPMLTLFAACSGDGDDGTKTGTETPTDAMGDDDDDGGTTAGDDDDDTTGCGNEVNDYVPESGETNAFYRSDIVAVLDDEDPSASLALSGGVTGTTSIQGTVVSFTPDAPLTNGETYTATLTYECGEESWDFTVGDVGAAADEAALPGSTYSLDLASGTWVQPAGVGDLIATLIGDVEVLFGVISVDPKAGTIPMIGALGDGNGNQDICSPTLDFPVDPTWDNPYWEVTTPSLDIAVDGFTISVTDVTLAGAFTADGSSIQGGLLRGVIDTEPLVEELSPGGTSGAVCLLISSIAAGVECVDCGDGDETCLEVWVADIAAGKVDGTITQLDKPDPSCN